VEQQVEDAQEVLAAATLRAFEIELDGADAGERRQVQLLELLGTRPGALPVEAPQAAVGEDAPANGAVGHGLGAGQIAQHLRGRRALGQEALRAALLLAAVERTPPALGFEDGDAVAVAARLLRARLGRGLGRLVREQQQVRHVAATAAGGGLLRQVVLPAQGFEHRLDQILLGGGLVGGAGHREAVQQAPDLGGEAVDVGLVEILPGRRLGDALGQEVPGEQLAAHGREYVRCGRSPAQLSRSDRPPERLPRDHHLRG